VTGSISWMNWTERDAAQRQPDQARPLPGPGRVRVQQVLLARLAEEDDAEELDHGVAGKGRDQGDQRGDDRDQHVEEGARQSRREQEALQQQPFGDEAAQRRQAGAGQRAHQGEPGDPGHVADQAAELAEAALAGGMQHGAGADEQQALEERMAGDVIERRGQRQRRHRLHVVGGEEHREADRGEHEAHVLDRRIGEQPLHVDLDRGEDDAEQGAGEAEREQGHAPPPELRRQQVEGDAQEAVDRGLQHHAAHQRRDRRGRGRMRLG
jgi:hypothetical protein